MKGLLLEVPYNRGCKGCKGSESTSYGLNPSWTEIRLFLRTDFGCRHFPLRHWLNRKAVRMIIFRPARCSTTRKKCTSHKPVQARDAPDRRRTDHLSATSRFATAWDSGKLNAVSLASATRRDVRHQQTCLHIPQPTPYDRCLPAPQSS
ncbi:hypothetical protein B0H17DRAFT_223114 [Mycena rosella]|uniref:Uncharacterized protein n=1 Tax=Mycena rosella TaxID=1033263 RepID=A0AAD7G5J9_MYCRO|nr:hypothetical protein B0H17DRAFT_223114 [Mycena rosella]